METQEIIRNELMTGEHILWCGQSNPKKLFDKSDIFLIPFSIFWFGFMIFWTVTASISVGFPGLFGIPFLIFGFYFSIGRFIAKRLSKLKTHYALTDQRILCVKVNRNGVRTNITSSDLKNIPSDSIVLGKNDIGTIIFGNIPYTYNRMDSMGNVFPMSSQSNIPTFVDIDNVNSVYQTYKNAVNALR